MDLLLVNAANYPRRPIFPYAFVQVSALARRTGLHVGRLDLWTQPRQRWGPVLREAVSRARPRAVGFHVRQTDSLIADEYRDEARAYLPLRATKWAIDVVRAETRAKVVVGGFGYSVEPQRALGALGADAGVEGEPDDFLRHFDAFAEGTLVDASGVANLLVRDGDGISRGPRQTFGPLDEPEYTDDVIGELKAFYGEAWLRGESAPTVAVEVSRGCPYQCFFCVEPQVKGRTVRKRDLDAAFDDVERLARAGLRKIWFVCSEANIGGKALLVELGLRVRRLHERIGGPPIAWTAYVLPHLGADDMRDLHRSGWFVGGFNDLVSLDDAELSRAAVPYRAEHAVSFLRAMHEVTKETAPTRDDRAADRRRHLGLFLAHAESSAESLRRTLDRLDEVGLLSGAEREPSMLSSSVVTSLRVFGDVPGLEATRPRFVVPPALAAAFGDEAGVSAFARYLEQVVMSPVYRRTRDEAGFVARRARRISALAGEATYSGAVRAAHARLAAMWRALGVGVDASDYAVARAMSACMTSVRDLARLVAAHARGADVPLLVAILLFEYGLPLDARIRAYVFGGPRQTLDR